MKKKGLNLRAAFAAALLLAACAPKELAAPPGMPLPAGLRLTAVRHPALAYGSVTGDASEKPSVVATAYARDLRGQGWQVELLRSGLVARRGPWQLNARLYARASQTVFTAEERHSHFYVVPRPRVHVNARFFEARTGDARSREDRAWGYERAKKFRESASDFESAIAVAADEEQLAKRFARRYGNEPHHIILDSRMRLGFVLARERQIAQASAEWRKLLHQVSSNGAPPAQKEKNAGARAWNKLARELDARAVGTAPTHDELADVHVLLASDIMRPRPVSAPQQQPLQAAPQQAPSQLFPPQQQVPHATAGPPHAPAKQQRKRRKPWWKFWK